MMQASDLRDGDNPAGIGAVQRAVQDSLSAVPSAFVFDDGNRYKRADGVSSAFVEQDQVIQALPANAANHALNIRPLPG